MLPGSGSASSISPGTLLLLQMNANCRAPFGIPENVHVNVQLSKGANESIAVHSQDAGGFALIPINLSEDGKNKLLPKFFECLAIEYACPVHPQHQRLELRLRGVCVFSCHLGSGKGFVSLSWRSLSQVPERRRKLSLQISYPFRTGWSIE
jgi:hypothetical protein